MNEYKKLNKTEIIDIEKARELALLMEEKNNLQRRMDYLEQLADDNEDLQEYLWKTKEGKILVISDIEDSHLKNIITYCAERGRIPLRVGQEYVKRFQLELPEAGMDNELPF